MAPVREVPVRNVPVLDVNVTTLIDERALSPLQWLVFVLCGLAAFLDGADSQSIGVAAPLIASEFGMPMGAFTPAFSAGLFGATIGALTFGPLGDRFGRKRMLVVAVSLLSMFTLLTPAARTFPELLAIRFLGGLGLGGATPCFITLCAEYAPRRRRAMLASVLWAAYPLGASLGGVVNATVIPALGWPAVFYIGGGLPLLVAALMIFWLPESLGYLVARDQASPQARIIVQKLDKTLAGQDMRLVTNAEPPVKASLPSLFTEGRATGTIFLWLIFFTAFGTTTVIVLLTPTLFRSSGIALSAAALMVGLHNFVGVAGMASAGRLVERFGPLALVPAFVLGAAILAILGSVAASVTLSAICMALLGVTVLLGASGGIALAATSYPTAIRSTGVGWAMGMGRLGQVCSPLLVGAMLQGGWDAPRILGVMALLPFLAGLFVLLRTLHLRRAGLTVAA